MTRKVKQMQLGTPDKQEEIISFSKSELTNLFFNRNFDIPERVSAIISDSVLRMVKECGDGAFDAAKKGYFWNKELFKEFMRETLNEMFFCTPEASKNFKEILEKSFTNIFETWLIQRLSEKDLDAYFLTIAEKIVETSQANAENFAQKKLKEASKYSLKQAREIALRAAIQNNEV